MKRFPLLLIAVLIVVAGLPLRAADTPTAPEALAILAKVKAKAATVQSLRMTFEQSKMLSLLPEPVRSSGVIEVDRTRRSVRWEFTGKSVLLVNSTGVRRFGADGKEESLAGGLRDETTLAPVRAMLDGDWAALAASFRIALIPAAEAGQSAGLRFTPKDQALGRYVQAMELRFHDDFSAPKSLALIGPSGDRTSYAFAAPALDGVIPEARFLGP